MILFPGLTILIQSLTVNIGCIAAGKKLHQEILCRIFKAPLMFFDATPQGRIINRFSQDIDVIDIILPEKFRSWFGCLLKVATVPFVIGIITPFFIIPFIPIMVLNVFIQV
jgi:ABC-type multidrug transport system fused ATPase/permease subunit